MNQVRLHYTEALERYNERMRNAYALLGSAFIILIIGISYIRPHSDDTISVTNLRMTFSLSSPAFEENGVIPAKYTCDGDRLFSVPLIITDTPEEAASLVLFMDDPDIPKGRLPGDVFQHWIVYDMPPTTKAFGNGGTPPGKEGKNSAGKNSYTGPCPPDGEHRYFFRLYALDSMLELPEAASREEVESAMGGHVIAEAQLMGRYTKQVSPVE